MKPRLGLLICGSAAAVVTLGLLSASTSAQNSATTPYKIGIVDLQRAVDEYKVHKTGWEALKNERDEIRAKLDKMREELRAEQERYAQVEDTLSEEQQTAKQAELDNKAFDLRDQGERAERDLQRKHDQLRQTVLVDLVKAIEELGAQGNYHLILEADPETRTGVMYHSPTLNMTQKVIDRLNRNS